MTILTLLPYSAWRSRSCSICVHQGRAHFKIYTGVYSGSDHDHDHGHGLVMITCTENVQEFPWVFFTFNNTAFFNCGNEAFKTLTNLESVLIILIPLTDSFLIVSENDAFFPLRLF